MGQIQEGLRAEPQRFGRDQTAISGEMIHSPEHDAIRRDVY